MKLKTDDFLLQNSIFIWIALATTVLLLVPLVAMQLTNEVRWNGADFLVMGSLLFGMASLFVLAARKAPRRRRALIATSFLAVFVYLWAELAVGVFTNLGS